ncbi:SIS domain-containing protein [Pseudolysinimonas kribbensis]|uniref:Glutamine--fructose-6-phosphate aminotransferase n=1 Tax=Pseudolysinimonas kribbensis TaxID=433641 RepID=A0ABQ6K3H1_9MICO|nr:SIS domain-containing protein [Pseudolysinimonas kribbensis]GMA94492.1 glutamine--fructose-6-phosphate aminotransferase [Pseudolysinimonas kribbensis]
MSITTSEIASQPALWERAIAEADGARELLGAPGERVLYLGCGTSAYIAESLAILREQAGVGYSDAAYGSEWRPGREYDRVVVVTRSGTTSEILDALALVPAGVHRTAITGVADAPVHALVDDALVLDYADEKSVVQTRFPTTTLIAARTVFGEDVSALPDAARRELDRLQDLDVAALDHFVYLGSGWAYGLAQEAALKIREAAQAWSESYPTLDYRHGPIAVAHPGSVVAMFGTPVPDLVQDVEATGAVVRTSAADPLVQLVAAHRLAVDVAASRGLDPDEPRALTRSVILR